MTTAYDTFQHAMANMRKHGTEPEIVQVDRVFFEQLKAELKHMLVQPNTDEPGIYRLDGIELRVVDDPYKPPELPRNPDANSTAPVRTPTQNE